MIRGSVCRCKVGQNDMLDLRSRFLESTVKPKL